jgi:hypothetical protein
MGYRRRGYHVNTGSGPQTKKELDDYIAKVWMVAGCLLIIPFFGLIGIPIALFFTLWALALRPLLP